jgi:hypothetical protein
MAWFDTETNLGSGNCDPADMQNKTRRRRIVTLLNEIRGLTVWDVTSLLGAFLATIAPGVLILYVFAPELVLQLATLKLFVFSAALTLPVIAINAFVVVSSPEEPRRAAGTQTAPACEGHAVTEDGGKRLLLLQPPAEGRDSVLVLLLQVGL